jgi:HlyD family secretion protein
MQVPIIGKIRQPIPWIAALIAAGTIGAGSVAYVAIQNQSAKSDISAMTVPVASQPLTVRIDASGTVQPVQTVNLSPKTQGILAELYVEQGDRVTQGQVIARMESNTLEAELMQATARVSQAEARLAKLRSGNREQEIAQDQAAVERAQAEITEAQARLDLATERVNRNRTLAAEGAISQDDLDEVLNQAATARATLEQRQANLRELQQRLSLSASGTRSEDIAEAEAQLQEAIANLREVEVQQEDTLIRAPFGGIVTQKYANEGAFVTPTTSASEASSATSTAIVAIAQGLEILAEVPEVDIQQLRVGQSVEIVADAYPNKVFQGKVRLIAPEAVVKQNVTSFQVRIDLVTGQTELLSGMNVDVTFVGDELSNAVVVPTVAIVTKSGETGVLVPDTDNQPVFRPIVLGTAVEDQTQILEGLEPGEQVFIDIPEGSEWNQPQE